MYRKFEISDQEYQEIKNRKKKEKTAKIYRRLQFLEMKYQWMTNIKIAPMVDVCNDTLTDWTDIYVDKWLDWICSLNYEWRRTSKLDAIKESIVKHVDDKNVSTIKELQDWINTSQWMLFWISWLWEYCKKNWICFTKKQD